MYLVGEKRVAKAAQVMGDLAGLRVLDLGCDVGGFSIQAAKLGAKEVMGVDGRDSNLDDAREALAREDLPQVTFRAGDVRDLSPDSYGVFDVVLCLGLLYHLENPADFLKRLAQVCSGYALIETNVALKPRTTHEGHRGLWYPEDTRFRGASLDNPRSFWPMKPSLVNMLADA